MKKQPQKVFPFFFARYQGDERFPGDRHFPARCVHVHVDANGDAVIGEEFLNVVMPEIYA